MGSQVLGAFVFGLYLHSPVLATVNYASITLALGIYVMIFRKFYRAVRV